MYSTLPAVASGSRVADVISETTATGPVASCRLEPKSAATIGGRNEAYRPKCGGSPASCAYAMLCGINTSATVKPDRRSSFTVDKLDSLIHNKKGRIIVRTRTTYPPTRSA